MSAERLDVTSLPSTKAVYDTVLDAARGMLGEVSLILSAHSEPHVVVGGWSPLLLNTQRIPHPGTKDVDVLFSRGASVEALNGVVGRFLAEGYLPSAKHDFQLLRVLQVGPRHMVFNVDLLHPKEAEEGFSSEMFVKHMDLGVVVSDLLPAHAFTRSIVTPHAAFILEDERSALVQVECRLPTWVCSSDLAPLGRLVLI